MNDRAPDDITSLLLGRNGCGPAPLRNAILSRKPKQQSEKRLFDSPFELPRGSAWRRTEWTSMIEKERKTLQAYLPAASEPAPPPGTFGTHSVTHRALWSEMALFDRPFSFKPLSFAFTLSALSHRSQLCCFMMYLFYFA